MELEISPEPSEAERRALVAALADSDVVRPHDVSRWAQDGDDVDDDAVYAVARPRSSRGATRA